MTRGCSRAPRALWRDETPDVCRVCEEAEQSRALQPFPICARCAYLIHDIIERATGREPGPLPSQVKPEARRLNAVGHVYYVRRADLIKIGFTTGLRARMAALLPDEILAVEPGTFESERARHRQFAETRVDGEWFRDSHELRAHIAAIIAEHGEPPQLPTLAASTPT